MKQLRNRTGSKFRQIKWNWMNLIEFIIYIIAINYKDYKFY